MLQTDSYIITSSLNFYRTDTLFDTQPTISKHCTFSQRAKYLYIAEYKGSQFVASVIVIIVINSCMLLCLVNGMAVLSIVCLLKAPFCHLLRFSCSSQIHFG